MKYKLGGAISVLYLLIFAAFEVYSAAATTLERNSKFPTWERLLGWTLFALPCVLIISLLLLYRRRAKLGFSLVLGNLCLYGSFMIFEVIAFQGVPVQIGAILEVGGIWAALFLAAGLSAWFLKVQAQTTGTAADFI